MSDVALDAEQQRAWLAFTRIRLRMNLEIRRQLRSGGGLSLPDYEVLAALHEELGAGVPVTVLAGRLGWERSRLSHHCRRLARRGLVHTGLAAADRRVTELSLRPAGGRAVEAATAGHVALIRRLFFGGLHGDGAKQLGAVLEAVHQNILDHGSPPRPGRPATNRERS